MSSRQLRNMLRYVLQLVTLSISFAIIMIHESYAECCPWDGRPCIEETNEIVPTITMNSYLEGYWVCHNGAKLRCKNGVWDNEGSYGCDDVKTQNKSSSSDRPTPSSGSGSSSGGGVPENQMGGFGSLDIGSSTEQIACDDMFGANEWADKIVSCGKPCYDPTLESSSQAMINGTYNKPNVNSEMVLIVKCHDDCERKLAKQHQCKP